jgi:phenylacetate-CoA ligase
MPIADTVRIQSTSGTTGKPIVAFHTQNDINLWEDCCARAIVAAGGTKNDILQVAYGYGLFTGGPGLNGGSHKVGCLTLPMSSGFTDRQMKFMVDFGTTILCCTPSYAEYLSEALEESGLRDEIKLKAGIFGAEAWTNEMRDRLEYKLGIQAFNIYGLTEMMGPGVSFECNEQSGMHINEDHFIAEIIDPQTEEVLPYGEKGEVVFTAITRKAFPLIRYRTRDICVLSQEDCSCGRTLLKMSRLMGRSDDMLIIKGVNVFPSQVETVLIDYGLSSNYQLVVDRINHSDTLEVRVELTPDMFSDTVRGIEGRERELRDRIKNVLGLAVKVTLVAPKSIIRSEGKAIRVIDNRK